MANGRLYCSRKDGKSQAGTKLDKCKHQTRHLLYFARHIQQLLVDHFDHLERLQVVDAARRQMGDD